MRWRQTAGCLVLLALALVIGGCASPADRAAITPQEISVARHFPYSLRVQTNGGAETGAMDTTNVSDADLKAAIEEAVSQSKLFSSIVQGGDSDYELSVRQTSLSKPIFGTTLTVDMEMAWSLTKVSDRTIVLRKVVMSTSTATMSDAFAFVTRLRLAVEAATRSNIAQGLQAIAELNL